MSVPAHSRPADPSRAAHGSFVRTSQRGTWQPDYTSFDSGVTGKASVRGRRISTVLLRGTWAGGYRAPNIGELFGGFTRPEPPSPTRTRASWRPTSARGVIDNCSRPVCRPTAATANSTARSACRPVQRGARRRVPGSRLGCPPVAFTTPDGAPTSPCASTSLTNKARGPKRNGPNAIRSGRWSKCLTTTYSHMGRPHTTIGAETFHC